MAARSISDKYWHEMAATETNPAAYKTLEVRQKIGICSLDSLDENNRTPLHVAAAKGNVAAIEFFLSQNAKFDLIDKEGKLASDYALLNPPIMVPFFTLFNKLAILKNRNPYTIPLNTPYPLGSPSDAELTLILKGCFPPPLAQSKRSFCYRANTDDFGRKINRLLFRRPYESGGEGSTTIGQTTFLQTSKKLQRKRDFRLSFRMNHSIRGIIFF